MTFTDWLSLILTGDTEEMTLTVNFDRDLEGYASDGSGKQHGGMLRKDATSHSNDSLQSAGSVPPPLPGSVPPMRPLVSPGGDSYYLPSADEASEIDDDVMGKHARKLGSSSVAKQQQLRAKSMDRDSDYCESTAAPRSGQLAHSLDSIPDDSGYHDPDNRILKDKIAYLEVEMSKRDEELEETRVKVEALVKVKSQVSVISLMKNLAHDSQTR